MHNNLQLLYFRTLAKYHKYSYRYKRNIKSGRFDELSRRKQNEIVSRIKRLRSRLESLSLQLKLGAVGAGIAIALNTTAASAQQLGPFVENTQNRFVRTFSATGSHKNIAFADLDNDGDLDAVFGLELGQLVYYENRGTPDAPSYFQAPASEDPFNSITASDGFATPELVDFDGDGDADLLLGTFDYDVAPLRYFENTDSDDGTIGDNPNFNEVPFVSNPFNVVQGTNFNVSQKVVDIDDDGDLDVFVGQNGDYSFSYESLLFFENNSGFSQQPLPPGLSDFEDFNSFFAVDPDFVDIDGDNDFDLLTGFNTGIIRFYENTGSASSPSFTARTGASNPFNDVNVGSYSAVSLADLDNDGDLDAVIGQATSFLPPQYYKNNNGVFEVQSGVDNPFSSFGLFYDTSPTFVDFDKDGNFDVVIGEKYNKTLTYLENDNGTLTPVTSDQNPFSDIVQAGFTENHSPEFVDIDNDGDEDLFIGLRDNQPEPDLAYASFFENDGDGNFVPATSPFSGSSLNRFAPTFADFDRDGDVDALVGEYFNSQLRYYVNSDFDDDDVIGNSPSFTLQTGASDPFNGITLGSTPSYLKPDFVDIDHDGDFDVVVGAHNGSYDGQIKLIENNNGILNPIIGTGDPFSGINVLGDSDPGFGDIDGDGDLDILIGDFDGNVSFFENQNSPPEINSNVTLITFTEGDDPRLLNDLIDLVDDGNDDILSVKVIISNGYQEGADFLNANTGSTSIIASFDSQTGILLLSGRATVDDYQQVLRTVTFENTSDNPEGSLRTITYLPVDFDNTNPQLDAIPETTIDIRIVGVNDPPTLVSENIGNNIEYQQNDPTIIVDDLVDIIDVDSENFVSATATITNFQEGDILIFEDQNGINGSFEGGILTLSGLASEASYEQALRSIQFSTSSGEGSRTIEFKINDGEFTSEAYARTVNILPADELTIYNAVSPNGDGLNDWWIIQGLTTPNNIKLYNRWGDLVEELNNFESSSTEPNNALDDLISGTYYYKLESPQGSFNGYITIKK